jgi:cytochrome b561
MALHTLFSQIHHTNGFLILLLAIGRLGWRLLGPQPRRAGRFPFQNALSFGTHALLYGLLLLLPFSGWAALSVYGLAPIWLFDLKGVAPPILPVQPLTSTFGYGFFAHIHLYGAYVGAALLSVHVLAALWHHWIVKDNVLLGMWPLGRDQNMSPPRA